MCLWVDVDTLADQTASSLHTADLTAAGISPDGTLVVTADHCGEAFLWRASDGALVHRFGGGGKFKANVAWGPDSGSVAWGSKVTPGHLNDHGPIEASFSLRDLSFHSPDETFVRAVEGFGEEGLSLVLDDNSLYVRRREQVVANYKPPRYFRINCFSFIDVKSMVVGFNTHYLELINSETGKSVRRFSGHRGQIMGIAPSPDRKYFLSGSTDQTLRVWSPSRSEPLLTLYFAGRDWIVWTPEGYYAASPGGEKLMGWQVNNGPDKLATFYPAERFHSTFYRPDVIRRVLDTGSVAEALAAADKERGQQTKLTDVSQVLPPKVAVTFPDAGQKLTATKFDVKASATPVGAHPVTSLQLLVDGRPYGGETGLRTLRSTQAVAVQERWTVELSPGKHRLAIVAASAVSQAISDEVDVLIAPEVAPAVEATSTLHLLAVGINTYPGRMKLDCAAPDAQAIEEAFRRHSPGIYRLQSTLLLNQKASRQQILGALDGLAGKVKSGDVVVLFYAGHGDCKLAGQFFLLPADVKVNKLAETGVSGEELRRRLGKLPCTVLLIMDCCYAGSFDAGQGKKKRALPTEAGDLVRELVSDDQGLVVMCGASKEQEAGEESARGHGYFTQALIEGLEGKAASKRDGLVYLTGLENYVEERVRELSNGEQYPTIGKTSLVRSFPLSKPNR